MLDGEGVRNLTTIARFLLFEFDHTEILTVSGNESYLYDQKIKLRGFPRLQWSQLPRTEIEINAVLSESRLASLLAISATRTRASLILGFKDWGSCRISRISAQRRSDGKRRVTVSFDQVGADSFIVIKYTPANIIAVLGNIDVDLRELLTRNNRTEYSYTAPTVSPIRAKQVYQDGDSSDPLDRYELALRLNEQITQDIWARIDEFRGQAIQHEAIAFTLQGDNLGSAAITELSWSIDVFKGLEPLEAECRLSLLSSPLAVTKPLISSFFVNGVSSPSLIPSIVSLTYTDPASGGSSLLEVTFDESASGLPVRGDTIQAVIKYESDTIGLDTGLHRCDRPIRDYNPQTVTIGSQSYDYDLTIGSQETVVFTGAFLDDIVNDIATAFGLAANEDAEHVVVGSTNDVSTNVTIQAGSFFEMLQQLAVDYGYSFRLKYGILSFIDYDTLDTQAAAFSLTPSDCLSARFTSRIDGVFRTAFFPHKTGVASVVDSSVPTQDELDFRPSPYYENVDSAFRRSRGELRKRNNSRHEASITIEGTRLAVGGTSINLVSFSDPSDNATYRIARATHNISASGWNTDLDLEKIYPGALP